MDNNCDFKYTCTPWYIYIVIVILILCSTLVATVYSSFSGGYISSNFGVVTSISCSVCNSISFLLCIGFLSLLCPTKPGRIVLWLFAVCSILVLVSNISLLIASLSGASVVGGISKYGVTTVDTSSDNDIIVAQM